MKPQTHNKNTIIINRKNQKRTAETQKTQRNYVFLFTSAFFCAFVVGIRIKSPSPRQTRATPRPRTGEGSGVRAYPLHQRQHKRHENQQHAESHQNERDCVVVGRGWGAAQNRSRRKRIRLAAHRRGTIRLGIILGIRRGRCVGLIVVLGGWLAGWRIRLSRRWTKHCLVVGRLIVIWGGRAGRWRIRLGGYCS